MNEMMVLYWQGFRFSPITLAIAGCYGIECPQSMDKLDAEQARI